MRGAVETGEGQAVKERGDEREEEEAGSGLGGRYLRKLPDCPSERFVRADIIQAGGKNSKN